MSNRSNHLRSIRPEISIAKVTEMTVSDEQFQNQTLRPILKFQNALLLSVFKNYIRKHKNRFFELSLEKRMEFIERAIQKDIKFRNSLKGMVIGHFTEEEYQCYVQNSSALNKRMMNMVIARLQDQILFFEAVELV